MLKKLFIFILFSFVFKITFAQEKCFVLLENKTDFPTNLIVAMTTSIISQFVKKVDQVPLSGIDKKNDKCIYAVNFEKSGDTTFLVLNGPNLNAYGDSKLEGSDAAQQALLKALYRSIPEQQNSICDLYDEYIKRCDDKKIITTNKIEKNQDDLEEQKDLEKDSNENRRWRFGLGSGSGTFAYTDSSVPALNGKFDHDLSGGTFTLSYLVMNEDNFFHGGGWRSTNVSGPETFSADGTTGSYSYYSSTYGYFDLSVTVTSFRTNFIHGIYGYNYEINDEMLFQPNLRYGWKFVAAEWKEKITWASYANQEVEQSDTFHTFGLDIVLPFEYKMDEKWSFGADICICSTGGNTTIGTGEYEFWNHNVFNAFIDYHL